MKRAIYQQKWDPKHLRWYNKYIGLEMNTRKLQVSIVDNKWKCDIVPIKEEIDEVENEQQS